jgi:hypothetical protein
MADYQAHPAVSRSYLVDILKSPAHAQAARENQGAPTKAMILGSATHTWLLEPELFDDEFLVADIDRRTKAGKEMEAQANEAGLEILKPDEMQQIDAMIKSVNSHKSASILISKGEAEQSVFWIDEETGIQLKCRPDFRRADGIIVDLKTCLDASPEAFVKTILNNNYHIQAAMYLDGLKAQNVFAENFTFIAVEKEAPFAVGVYVLDNDFIEIGRQQYKKALQILANCIKEKKYPAYSEDIVELKPPKWAFTKRENEEFVV